MEREMERVSQGYIDSGLAFLLLVVKDERTSKWKVQFRLLNLRTVKDNGSNHLHFRANGMKRTWKLQHSLGST